MRGNPARLPSWLARRRRPAVALAATAVLAAGTALVVPVLAADAATTHASRRKPAHVMVKPARKRAAKGTTGQGPEDTVPSSSATPTASSTTNQPPAAVTSNETADPSSFWGDTSGIPAAKNVLTVKVLNRTNGKYPDSQVYWSFNGQVHSIAEQPYVDMPANAAGRMYFHLGSPTSRYSDFIEFTVGSNVFNGNTTRVDAFSIKLAMRLHAMDGYDFAVGEDLATFAEDRDATFQRFRSEVPAEFKHLADVEAPYRIPAPTGDVAFRPGGQYAAYLKSYAASVGITAETYEITGCSGVLATDPARCAALNRHLAAAPQSQWSDPTKFYASGPANYYAKFWHDHALGRLAYGFPYDDYASQSSFVSHANPQYLLVAVGW